MMMFVFISYLVFAQGTRIEPNTSIKVESGTNLDISGGNLILESDVTGDASLIDLGSVTYNGAVYGGKKLYKMWNRQAEKSDV